MPDQPNPSVSSRKQPRQARSTELVAAILDAAAQVLARDGARRFTTARVAERAGVSVGSIYQYFPNKAAILFRLQSDEWRRTSDLLHAILADARRPPLLRLRDLVHAFVRSECEEAEMRGALDDAAPLYRDAPEAQAARSSGAAILQPLLADALPAATVEARRLAADLVMATLTAVAKRFSEAPRTDAEITGWADAMAEMLGAYLEAVATRSLEIPFSRDATTRRRPKS